MDNIKRMPTLAMFQPLFENEEQAISFLFQHSVVYNVRQCPRCETNMKVDLETKVFRCCKRRCNQKVSLLRNSLFQHHRIPCCKILMLAYLWLTGVRSGTAVNLIGYS